MKRANRKPTIYDVANAAAVSASSVSAVLSGKKDSRRISEETAARIVEAAESLGYSTNLKARGLRTAKSGLAAMVIPHHRNRFFAELAEEFESRARERNLTPIVISSYRDPEVEQTAVQALLEQQVEFVFLVGATADLKLDNVLMQAGTPCVNIDLPGSSTASVVTDNFVGAREMTTSMLAHRPDLAEKMVFIGGIAGEFATEERLAGFREAMSAHGHRPADDRIFLCGYWPEEAFEVTRSLFQGSSTVTAFVNSISAFEGVARFLRTQAASNHVVGCFDWDPFAELLPSWLHMVHQDTTALTIAAFKHIDQKTWSRASVEKIVPVQMPESARPLKTRARASAKVSGRHTN